MRITSGEFGGRSVVAPKTAATRPMTDKIRAALFDIVGPVEGYSVADAYAGSGAVGIEALSRGAGQVIAIESSRIAVNAIKENASKFNLGDQFKLRETSVESWLKQESGDSFDLIIADPPYADLKLVIIDELARRLRPQGRLVLSHSSRSKNLELSGVELLSRRDYGDTSLSFYKSA